MINLTPNRVLVGYMVRHGELQSMNSWDGWGDYSLNEEGLMQAEKAAQYLSFERIGRVICSDLVRTTQTGEIILNECNVCCPQLGTDPNLRAWMVAGFTGLQKTPANLAKFKYYCDHPDVPIPGGESKNAFRDRIQVVSQYLACPIDGYPSVLAIHNSVIKCFMGVDEIKECVSPGGVVAVFMNVKGEFEFEVVLGAVEPEIGIS
jgi:broad specificity phosphatase PhoE